MSTPTREDTKEEEPKTEPENQAETELENDHENGSENALDDEHPEDDEDDDDEVKSEPEKEIVDPKVLSQQELIRKSIPKSPLEIALSDDLKRKEQHIQRLTGEIQKLKAFISKRKQTYKRKRKEVGAPTRALSAYNIFVQDRFSRLAKENEAALKSADSDAQLKRVPPASLVASTGNQWKELSAEEKAYYEERAKEDRKRYEEQMAKYQPPDKQSNRKRNKTGYNMFFSAHVLQLKRSEAGVPSERGSVARLVGNAWKELTPDERQYYEREADKQNGMHPVDKDEEDEDIKRPSPPQEYPPMAPPAPHEQVAMHHGGVPPSQLGLAPVVHQPTYDHRYGYPPPYVYPAHPAHEYAMQAAPPPPPPGHRHQGRGVYDYGAQGYPPPHHPQYQDRRGAGL